MNRHLAIGYVLLIAALMFWSGNAVVARAAMLADVPPLAFNFWRWFGALVIFLPFTAARVWRLRREFVDRWGYYALCGLASVTLFNSLYYTGLQYTTAVQGSLIMAILPMVVLILVAVVLRTRITGRQIAGVVLSIAGAAVIVLQGDPELVMTLAVNIGDVWCLVAVLAWAVQILLMRWKPETVDMLSFMTVIIGAGVVMQVPLVAWEHLGGRPFVPDAASIGFIFYVALFAGVIGTTMYNAGVIRVGAATSGYFGNLYPVFASGLAIIFLGETFAWFHGLGGVLVLSGIGLATYARGAAAEASS